MRILHIDTEPTWRGGERQLCLLMDGLKTLGIPSFVAASQDSELIKRVDGKYESFIFRHKNFMAFSELLKLKKFCYENKINVIDAHSSKAHSLGLALKKLNPRLILIVHRRVDYAPNKTFWSRRKYLSPLVDRYVSISLAIKAELLKFGIAPEKVKNVYSAVPDVPWTIEDRLLAKKKLRAEWGLDDDRLIIGNIAYLTPQKGHETLIRALAMIQKNRGPAFFCYIAGGGALKDSLEKLARELGVTDLKFLGIRHDVRDLLLAADIYAMPSHYEGLGTSILDAINYGVPVAATNVGGIPEIITHNKTGLLSPMGDFVGHGENLIQLLTDSDSRITLASAADAYRRQYFSVDRMVAGNLELYRNECLGKI